MRGLYEMRIEHWIHIVYLPVTSYPFWDSRYPLCFNFILVFLQKSTDFIHLVCFFTSFHPTRESEEHEKRSELFFTTQNLNERAPKRSCKRLWNTVVKFSYWSEKITLAACKCPSHESGYLKKQLADLRVNWGKSNRIYEYAANHDQWVDMNWKLLDLRKWLSQNYPLQPIVIYVSG